MTPAEQWQRDRAWLVEREACPPAMAWFDSLGSPLEQAWQLCERADWLLWLAVERGVDRVVLVRVACAIVRTVLHIVTQGDDRPRLAIEAAEAWADDPTDERRTAVSVAATAAWSALVELAAEAAEDMAWASTRSAARSAGSPPEAAWAAWAARRACPVLAAEHAAIVRRMIPWESIPEVAA